MVVCKAAVVGTVLLGSFSFVVSRGYAGAVELKVGHSQVNGKRIQTHSGRWSMKAKKGDQWVENAVVFEETERAKVDGRDVIRRTQRIEMATGVVLVDKCVLDGKTLAPLEYTRDFEVSEGARFPSGMAIHAETIFNGMSYQRTERTRAGEVSTGQVELLAPMFDLNVFGLVVAALPLKSGYSAVLPVAMDTSGGGQCAATQYKVTVTVVGSEEVNVNGKELDAWRVDTTWADYVTGVVSSPGGPEESGGAYWIVRRRKGKTPHVLRYKNDTTDIDLALVP